MNTKYNFYTEEMVKKAAREIADAEDQYIIQLIQIALNMLHIEVTDEKDICYVEF